MGDEAKPYTMDRLEAVICEWEQGGKPRFVSDDLRATVEELERLRAAADAMEAELEAARTYLRERCFFDPQCSLCRCKAQVLKRMDKLRRPR